MVGVAYELLKSVEESPECWEKENNILDQVTCQIEARLCNTMQARRKKCTVMCRYIAVYVT